MVKSSGCWRKRPITTSPAGLAPSREPAFSSQELTSGPLLCFLCVVIR